METTKKTKRWKKRYILLFIFVIILVAAYITNPNEEIHKNALKARTNTILKEIVTERNDATTATIWQFAGNELLNGFIESHVSVDNYYLFSIPKIHWENKTYPIGFGAFGKVYITKELNKNVIQPILEDIEDNINNSLPGFNF